MKHYNIPIFLPELACPFRCVYCNQFSITGRQQLLEIEDVKMIIDRHLASFQEDDRFVEVAFFGGNFTGLPLKMQDDYLKTVQPYLEKGLIQGIRCSTRPDYIDEKRVKELKSFGMLNIELGAQTTNDVILRKIGRGHTFKDIENASQIIVNEGITLGLQMMIGLPYDTRQDDRQTAADIVRLGAAETRIYPCVVVKDTELERIYEKGEFQPLTIGEAVEQSADLYEYFTENNVKVLRIGLHTSDDLNGEAFVAGPYHKNFAEMVLSRIWGRKLDKIDEKSDKIVVEVPEDQLNHAIGYRGENKRKLQERYKKVTFVCRDARPCVSTTHRVAHTIIASSTMPEPAKESLSKMGDVVWLEPSDKAYPSISTHPDIFFFCKDERHCDTVIYANNVDVAPLDGIRVVKGGKSVGNAYPETVPYNAVGVGNMLIHNLKYTDEKIKELFENISTKSVQLNVNQGYTRCNLLALDEHNLITSDMGIKKCAELCGCNVLYVDPHQIALPGQDYGFFPGCCGLVGDSVVVCGALKHLKECKELRKFIRRNKMNIIELYDGKPVDVGSIFFIRRKA